MIDIKEAIYFGVWGKLQSSWFIDTATGDELDIPTGRSVTSFSLKLKGPYDSVISLTLSDGREYICRLHEQSVYRSFYNNK